MKEKIVELDFIRAVCAVGIVCNHFTIESKNNLQKVFYTYPSGMGSVGYTLVTVFFLLSGAVLYYNYHEKMESFVPGLLYDLCNYIF